MYVVCISFWFCSAIHNTIHTLTIENSTELVMRQLWGLPVNIIDTEFFLNTAVELVLLTEKHQFQLTFIVYSIWSSQINWDFCIYIWSLLMCSCEDVVATWKLVVKIHTLDQLMTAVWLIGIHGAILKARNSRKCVKCEVGSVKKIKDQINVNNLRAVHSG